MSIPSASRPFFRVAAAAARLVAFCFSRRRSATSLSTTLSASWCSVSSRALEALCSESETSLASSVWRSVAVVEDLFFYFYFFEGGSIGRGQRRTKKKEAAAGKEYFGIRYLPVLQGVQNFPNGFVGNVSTDGIFDFKLLLLLVESPADDVEIDGLNDKIL
jgi:hypothetical protein